MVEFNAFCFDDDDDVDAVDDDDDDAASYLLFDPPFGITVAPFIIDFKFFFHFCHQKPSGFK
jgi:hypothetical protein